jgi:hypothetical protein
MLKRRGALALAALAISQGATADEVILSPAQIALFETPHLDNLEPPIRLDYAFRREETDRPVVEDSIRLEVRVAAEMGRRDVAVEFLTGPRAIHYPPANGFRGNPLLLFALDRDARELSAATGGSTVWFRNRIRRAVAEAAELRAGTVVIGGQSLAATNILFTPFAGEPRARRYQAMQFDLLLCDRIPGRIHSIRTEVPEGEGGGRVTESIVFAGTAPLPAVTQ